MNKTLLSTGGIALAVVTLLAVNILGTNVLRGGRVDLTENKLYTLSEGTKNVLGSMQEPVSLRFYFSRDVAGERVPQIMDYARRVEELLEEFVAHARGKLTLEVIDPEPFSEQEDLAVQAGLQGAPVQGDVVYFGLAGSSSTDASEVIPFFTPDEKKQQFLEYDLAKLVYTLANPTKRVIGVLSTLPIEGGPSNPMNPMARPPEPWYVVDQIRQLYEVRTIMPNATEIPEEVSTLLLVHPKNLTDATWYAIDQFALRGGSVLAFVDPYCEADEPPTNPQNPLQAMTAPRGSELGPLAASWGLELDGENIVGDRKSAIRVRSQTRGREDSVDYIVYLQLGEDNFDQEEVVTSGLNLVRMGTPGALTPAEGASTTFTPLVQSSEESSMVPVSQVQFMTEPKTLLADFLPDGSRKTLAARISGRATSAFPDGAPASPDEGAEAPDPTAHLAEGDLNVIVFADADLLQDRWWISVQNFGGTRIGFPQADNGSMVINALDFLGGSTDLVSLRARAGSVRPFDVVDELEREAEQAFRRKEQDLLAKLDEAERRIQELQGQREDGSSMLLTKEQVAEIDRAREEQLNTRRELRAVQHNLNKDIEALGARLKFVNIALLPLLITVLAAALGYARMTRRRSA